MQSEEVILSGFPDQFLIEGDGNQLTVRETWGWSRPLQGVLDHCCSFHCVIDSGKNGGENGGKVSHR